MALAACQLTQSAATSLHVAPTVSTLEPNSQLLTAPVLRNRRATVNKFNGLRCHVSSNSQHVISMAQRTRRTTISATATADAPVAVSSAFIGVKTEQEMMDAITQEGAKLRLPERVLLGMRDFYDSYAKAIASSGVDNVEEVSTRVMATVLDRIILQFRDPYTFPSHHLSLTSPYDYYAFGQNYVRPLINFKESFVSNLDLLDQIQANLDEDHNVVLLTNHQTEADPAVMALMLEGSHPRLATSITYVAGDRVVLDPVCKPFSMGRNLLCVHSKKHLNDIPELADQKRAANRHTLKAMAQLFKKGGNLLWIAPSGGRDRPDPNSDEVPPAPFDASAVELMRRLATDSGRPSHLHPVALLSYDIMPPPRSLEKQLGEKRVIGYHGVGVSVGEEVDFNTVTEGVEDRKEARDVFSNAVYASVREHYTVLVDAINNKKGLGASTDKVKLAQTWA